jgi:predicted nucleic acid-binding protein
MTGFLLDTNHLSAAVRLGSPIRDRIHWVRERGASVGTCVPALCELEVGVQQVRDPSTYRKALGRLLTRLRIWQLDQDTAWHYGDVYHEARRSGLILSQVDMMLAALARQMGLVLLTSDRDFEGLPGLSTENWLAS